jgi:transposase
VERIVLGRQFCSSQKRGDKVGKTKRGKGTKWMVVVDGAGVLLGKYLDSASPAEVKLAEKTLATIRVSHGSQPGRPRQKPERVIADKAYDSDPLRKRLQRRGIELIVPHKRNRIRPPTQDGRALRRYRHRWTVERTIAWLGNFRRLVVRWDRSTTIYEAFFHIACFMIVLRRVVQ